MLNVLFVGIGGFIGSVCRYLISLIKINEPFGFPFKTLITNIIGAFVIGLIAAYTLKNANADPKLILLLKTGLCGGFTTFSTFALESSNLMKNGSVLTAVIYILASVILSIAAVFAAEMLMKL